VLQLCIYEVLRPNVDADTNCARNYMIFLGLAKLLLEQSTVTCFCLPSWQTMEPKGSGFMSSQIMTPAEARRDTKNLFHEMSVFTLQNLTDLTEQDGSINSKVQGFCECGYKCSDPVRAGNLFLTKV